uniref:Uncharacterized protein n=1 Tax=Arundo donax TaxID=35708 RepID=A0A0A9A9B0_ARUDO
MLLTWLQNLHSCANKIFPEDKKLTLQFCLNLQMVGDCKVALLGVLIGI